MLPGRFGMEGAVSGAGCAGMEGGGVEKRQNERNVLNLWAGMLFL
jgi:hypothetical protein